MLCVARERERGRGEKNNSEPKAVFRTCLYMQYRCEHFTLVGQGRKSGQANKQAHITDVLHLCPPVHSWSNWPKSLSAVAQVDAAVAAATLPGVGRGHVYCTTVMHCTYICVCDCCTLCSYYKCNYGFGICMGAAAKHA